MKSNTLFRSFIINSIISFLITGSLLSFFVSRFIINQEIEHNIEIVKLTLGHSLNHWFESIDLHAVSQEDMDHLDEEFHSLNDLGNIADIRIWNSARELVYSNDKTLIGALILEEDHYANAQNKTIDYELIHAEAEENSMLSNYGEELIEIYLPIIDDHSGELIGVFEVYRSFDTSRITINEGLRNVVFILSIGLLILYFFLAKTIYSSSNKLINQNREIKNQASELKDSYVQLSNLYRSIILAITNAIDARDKFTSGHSQRVAEITVEFAKHLGLASTEVEQLEIAALLHDIGKLGVPESIINKTDTLTDEEFNQIKQHPLIGEKIVKDIDVLQDTINVIKYHHEQYSGKGYPTGMTKKDIPYQARIIAITDAYDAMTSDRPYRKALSNDMAIKEIVANKGIQFDPELADAFLGFLSGHQNL